MRTCSLSRHRLVSRKIVTAIKKAPQKGAFFIAHVQCYAIKYPTAISASVASTIMTFIPSAGRSFVISSPYRTALYDAIQPSGKVMCAKQHCPRQFSPQYACYKHRIHSQDGQRINYPGKTVPENDNQMTSSPGTVRFHIGKFIQIAIIDGFAVVMTIALPNKKGHQSVPFNKKK